MRNSILIFALVCLCSYSFAQSNVTGIKYNQEEKPVFETTDKTYIKKADKFLDELYAYVPGGTFIMGGGRNEKNDSLNAFGSIDRQVTVSSFWMKKTEVSNAEWKLFYGEMEAKLGKEEAKQFLPDTTQWDSLGMFNNTPMVDNYYWHPAFDDYPVVGISWEQAKAYCEWMTGQFQQEIDNSDKFNGSIVMRLPTEAEWEYTAAYDVVAHARELEEKAKDDDPDEDKSYLISRMEYAWVGDVMEYDKKGLVFPANFGFIRDISGVTIKMPIDDAFLFTAPASTKYYKPNLLGIEQLGGNVSEWVEDVYRPVRMVDVEDLNPLRERTYIADVAEGKEEVKARVYKGASFWDDPLFLKRGTRRFAPSNAQKATIGFRPVVMISVER